MVAVLVFLYREEAPLSPHPGRPSMQYNIDLAQLEKQYKRLQWQVHPDRLAGHAQPELDYSSQSVMHINMAYQVRSGT